MEVKLNYGGAVHRARRDGPGEVTVFDRDGSSRAFHLERLAEGDMALENEDGLHRAVGARSGETVWVHWRGRTWRFEMDRGRGRGRTAAPGGLASPMPGQVQKVLVEPGDAVEAQQPLVVVEAMKMQLEIKSPRAGRVKRVLAAPGQPVAAGAPLVELEEEE